MMTTLLKMITGSMNDGETSDAVLAKLCEAYALALEDEMGETDSLCGDEVYPAYCQAYGPEAAEREVSVPEWLNDPAPRTLVAAVAQAERAYDEAFLKVCRGRIAGEAKLAAMGVKS